MNTVALKDTSLALARELHTWKTTNLPLQQSLAPQSAPVNDHKFGMGPIAVQEMQSYLGKLVDLHAEGKQEALRVVQKLHRNLGHPSAQSLVDLLTARGASPTVLSVAENYLVFFVLALQEAKSSSTCIDQGGTALQPGRAERRFLDQVGQEEDANPGHP